MCVNVCALQVDPHSICKPKKSLYMCAPKKRFLKIENPFQIRTPVTKTRNLWSTIFPCGHNQSCGVRQQKISVDCCRARETLNFYLARRIAHGNDHEYTPHRKRFTFIATFFYFLVDFVCRNKVFLSFFLLKKSSIHSLGFKYSQKETSMFYVSLVKMGLKFTL